MGSFDPLFDDHRPAPLGLYNANDFTTTGLALVQLHAHDGTVLDRLVERHGITPLDYIGDEGWLVRLSEPPSDSLRALYDDAEVRLAGPPHPGWRIDGTIAQGRATERLALVPAAACAHGGFAQ